MTFLSFLMLFSHAVASLMGSCQAPTDPWSKGAHRLGSGPFLCTGTVT